MASLLSTGRAIKGSALAGLTSVAQQEASRNIAEEQLKQAKEAQTQQLIGTGLGVSGAYLAPKAIAAMKDSAEVAKLLQTEIFCWSRSGSIKRWSYPGRGGSWCSNNSRNSGGNNSSG